MEHKALYRQFRPMVFDDIVGQAAITKSLKSQIGLHKLGHAYLLTGPRGTGKTTLAKVLSRAVNCENPVDLNPCNTCETCLSILHDSNMDVIEMDAASNNGVDDIRELRENVKFPPSSCKTKVMIIDEVHMLSKGAFNALLKTLEEPPAYMLFVLATTEPHKLPATITSRCQRFELSRIDNKAVFNHLLKICGQIGVTPEEDALKLIIRMSEGAMRDALSLLEQCVSYSGSHLSYSVAAEVLGRTADDQVHAFAEVLIKGDVSQAFLLARRHYDKGRDVNVLIGDLIEIFRKGMLHQTVGKAILDDVTESEQQWFEAHCEGTPLATWLYLLEALIEMDQQVKYASQPWIMFELMLTKALIKPPLQAYDLLIDRIEKLEQGVSNHHTKPQATRPSPTNHQEGNAKQELHHKQVALPSKPTPKIQNSQDPKDGPGPKEPVSPNVNVSDMGQISFNDIQNKWDALLLAIKNRLVSTHALMREVQPVAFENGQLTLLLNSDLKILKPALENEDNLGHILAACQSVYGMTPKVVIIDEPLSDNRVDSLKAYFEGALSEDGIIIK